jgi:hypothetical protein
MQGRT